MRAYISEVVRMTTELLVADLWKQWASVSSGEPALQQTAATPDSDGSSNIAGFIVIMRFSGEQEKRKKSLSIIL